MHKFLWLALLGICAACCLGHHTRSPQKNINAFILAEDNYTAQP